MLCTNKNLLLVENFAKHLKFNELPKKIQKEKSWWESHLNEITAQEILPKRNSKDEFLVITLFFNRICVSTYSKKLKRMINNRTVNYGQKGDYRIRKFVENDGSCSNRYIITYSDSSMGVTIKIVDLEATLEDHIIIAEGFLDTDMCWREWYGKIEDLNDGIIRFKLYGFGSAVCHFSFDYDPKNHYKRVELEKERLKKEFPQDYDSFLTMKIDFSSRDEKFILCAEKISDEGFLTGNEKGDIILWKGKKKIKTWNRFKGTPREGKERIVSIKKLEESFWNKKFVTISTTIKNHAGKFELIVWKIGKHHSLQKLKHFRVSPRWEVYINSEYMSNSILFDFKEGIMANYCFYRETDTDFKILESHISIYNIGRTFSSSKKTKPENLLPSKKIDVFPISKYGEKETTMYSCNHTSFLFRLLPTKEFIVSNSLHMEIITTNLSMKNQEFLETKNKNYSDIIIQLTD